MQCDAPPHHLLYFNQCSTQQFWPCPQMLATTFSMLIEWTASVVGKPCHLIVTYHNSCSGINAMRCDASHSAQMFLRPGYALPGMCLAWILIIFHEMRMDRLATANVQQAINKVGGIPHGNLRDMIAAEKGRIAASKTFRQRMLSIKVLAGF